MAGSALSKGVPQIPQKIRFSDFAPDAESITPGVVLACGNVYPTFKGYRSYPSMTPISTDPLESAALGAFTAELGSNNIVIVAGTVDQLFLYDGGSWDDQGLTLTSITDGRWRFDQYGGLIIGVNGEDPPQAYNGTGTFAALGGSPPVASIVQASNYSLFLIEAASNTWWSSLSATIWTPSIATQTVTDDLDETTGPITAAHRLRAGMVLYKTKAIHFGQFEGPPVFWNFQLVSSQVGAPCQEAVANMGDIHMWPGPDDFYSFDGYSLGRIPNSLKEWFFDNLNGIYAAKIAARWDQKRSLVFWHFPSRVANPAGSLNAWIALNTRTGKWSCSLGETENSEPIDIPIYAAIQTGALTYDILTTLYPTYGDFDGTVYGDFQSHSIENSGAIRASDHHLCLYTGAPAPATITTHDFGDYENMYEVSNVKPRFAIYPEDGASLTPLNQNRPGETPVAGLSTDLSWDGRFNVRNTARLQRFQINLESDAEILGVDVECGFAGDR